jgi:hypothetical protein
MDDLPLDFTEYLSKRLGLPEEETKRLLVAWLRTYEPVTPIPLRLPMKAFGPDLAESLASVG